MLIAVGDAMICNATADSNEQSVHVISGAPRLLLVGFSEPDQSRLVEFLDWALPRAPGYRVTSNVDEADLLIVDWDKVPLVQKQDFLARGRKILAIGRTPWAGYSRFLRKPIKLIHLLHSLDQILLHEGDSHWSAVLHDRWASSSQQSIEYRLHAESIGSKVQAEANYEQIAEVHRLKPSGDIPTITDVISVSNNGLQRRLSPGKLNLNSAVPISGQSMERVLIVTGDFVEGRILRNRLESQLVEVDWVRTVDESLAALTETPYSALFIDVLKWPDARTRLLKIIENISWSMRLNTRLVVFGKRNALNAEVIGIQSDQVELLPVNLPDWEFRRFIGSLILTKRRDFQATDLMS